MKRRHIVLSVLAAAGFLILYIFYYLYGGSATPMGATTTGQSERFQSFIVERRVQWICEFCAGSRHALTYLTRMFAGGLCIRKTLKRRAWSKHPSIRGLGAGIVD